MDFFKQIFRYFIINVIMFILYYVLSTLFTALGGIFEWAGWDIAFQITGAVLAYLGFMAIHIARITDRNGYGIKYLYLNSKNPADPKSAFNIFTDWKRGNWEFLAYAALMLIATTVYAQIVNGGASDGTLILLDLLLPQTVFFKLTSSPALGLAIPLVIFYLVTALIQVKYRRVWLLTPLSEDERMKVDPDWTPAEEPAEELPAEEEK
jgi:hypothetical protein